MADLIAEVLDLLDNQGGALYGGEAVTQREHALQAAHAAERASAGAVLITAALLHDIGHLLPGSWVGDGPTVTDLQHESAGARWLAERFPPEVVDAVRLHVAAKRYLCYAEPGYWAKLSEASKASLRVQGGPMTAAEAEEFLSQPHAQAAVQLRRWDDAAKVPNLSVPEAAHYRPHLAAVMNRRPS